MLWKHRAPARSEHSHRALAQGLSSTLCCFSFFGHRQGSLVCHFEPATAGEKFLRKFPVFAWDAGQAWRPRLLTLALAGVACLNCRFVFAFSLALGCPWTTLFPFRAYLLT